MSQGAVRPSNVHGSSWLTTTGAGARLPHPPVAWFDEVEAQGSTDWPRFAEAKE